MKNDPQELKNLADDHAHTSILGDLHRRLYQILDAEEVNRQAFSDQAQMIEKLGGMEAINAMPGFNHTPIT